MEMKFKHYSDPGHGWVAVKRKLIVELGLLNAISPYSYQKGGTVYLEEDCDAYKVLDKLNFLGVKVKVDIKEQSERSSPIRSYDRFSVA